MVKVEKEMPDDRKVQSIYYWCDWKVQALESHMLHGIPALTIICLKKINLFILGELYIHV